jgi:hypothetical protein
LLLNTTDSFINGKGLLGLQLWKLESSRSGSGIC